MYKSRKVATCPAMAGGPFDWEAQKQQLLASLDADNKGPGLPVEIKQPAMEIEKTVWLTNDVAAARQCEATEAKRQIPPLPEPSVGRAVHGTASDGVDHHLAAEVERKRLQRLQLETCEKLRQAEVALAIERAQFARERRQFEERIHALESELTRRSMATGSAENSNSSQSTAKPARDRWLAHLGLMNKKGSG